MYLDSDDFISGAADQVAFTYKMLGGDVLDIELMEGNVYSSYETAVLEYSSIINSHQAENVLSNYLGMTRAHLMKTANCWSGPADLSLKFPKFTFEYAQRIAAGLSGGIWDWR